MWDEAEIVEDTSFHFKVRFINDHREFTREILKENALAEITLLEYTPRWHEFLTEFDKIAYYHESYGWCIA